MAIRGNPYQSLSGSKRTPVKTFTLPVSGSVVLYGPEIAVVNTPEFQRLAGIKQLGTSYVVYRGALHARFEHSLGTLHQADLMIRAIQGNPADPYEVDDDAWRLARLGALLHDLPHVPFGHTLEDELHLLERHDENKERVNRLLIKSQIGAILRKELPFGEFDELLRVLQAKKDADFAALRHPFVGDIVGNTVCADLLDYVQRDLLACGLPSAFGERFLDYLSVVHDDEGKDVDHRRLVLNLGKRGMPRPDVESEVVKLLSYRYELAERVYFHHAKNAASVMIGRAVQEAGFAAGDKSKSLDHNFMWLSDELLLEALARPDVEQALGVKADSAAVGDRTLASQLARGVQRRDLFKIAYLSTWDDIPDAVGRIAAQFTTPQSRRELEDRFADMTGLPRGRVLVHVPGQKMMSKDADVRVRTTRNEVVKLHEWDKSHSNRLRALNEAHERLWRVMVFVHPAAGEMIGVVRAAAEDVFKAPSRYVPREHVLRYMQAVFDSLAGKWSLTLDDRQALEGAAYFEGVTRRDVERVILGMVRSRRKKLGLPAVDRLGKARQRKLPDR